MIGAHGKPLRVHSAGGRTDLAVAAPETRQVLDWKNAGQQKCSNGDCCGDGRMNGGKVLTFVKHGGRQATAAKRSCSSYADLRVDCSKIGPNRRETSFSMKVSVKLSVTLKSSIIAWPFHAVFTKPYVWFGETCRHLDWGRSELIDIPAESTLSVGSSYRWALHQRLAETSYGAFGRIHADTDVVKARLGPARAGRSPQPFTVSSTSSADKRRPSLQQGQGLRCRRW